MHDHMLEEARRDVQKIMARALRKGHREEAYGDMQRGTKEVITLFSIQPSDEEAGWHLHRKLQREGRAPVQEILPHTTTGGHLRHRHLIIPAHCRMAKDHQGGNREGIERAIKTQSRSLRYTA